MLLIFHQHIIVFSELPYLMNCKLLVLRNKKRAFTCLNHLRTPIISKKERKQAGNAARIAKLISFALRIWFSSSIALIFFPKIILDN